MGPTLGGGVEPGRADGAWPSPSPAQPAPGPAGDIYKITGPSPTRSVTFQSHAMSARPRQRVSNLTGRLPGLARAILVIFSLFLRAVCLLLLEVSRPRRARKPGPRGLFGESLALYNWRTKQSLPCPHTGLRIPLVRCGLRSALIRHISSHDFIFFREKLKKFMS